MATYDETIYTAACDLEDCTEIYGTDYDWSAGWHQYPYEAEAQAEQGTWTRINGQLICDTNDTEHDAARHPEPDPRPNPGPGQLPLIPHRPTSIFT